MPDCHNAQSDPPELWLLPRFCQFTLRASAKAEGPTFCLLQTKGTGATCKASHGTRVVEAVCCKLRRGYMNLKSANALTHYCLTPSRPPETLSERNKSACRVRALWSVVSDDTSDVPDPVLSRSATKVQGPSASGRPSLIAR
eukprot:6647071-Prymnesium_polylepis.1